MAVETVTLLDLGPIIAAIMGPMLAFAAVSMRYQHNDTTKTRELISESNRENRQLIERASRENRQLIERATDKLSAKLADHRQLSEQSTKRWSGASGRHGSGWPASRAT